MSDTSGEQRAMSEESVNIQDLFLLAAHCSLLLCPEAGRVGESYPAILIESA